jgi:hypothetical protein
MTILCCHRSPHFLEGFFIDKKLTTNPDALGSISVETTAAGIAALAASEHVKAIIEDQAVSLVR